MMAEDNVSSQPSFSAPLYAGLRQGSKELSQILPAFPQSVQPVEEIGTLGNPTPQLVTEQITGEPGPRQADKGYEAMFNTHAARASQDRPLQRAMER